MLGAFWVAKREIQNQRQDAANDKETLIRKNFAYFAAQLRDVIKVATRQAEHYETFAAALMANSARMPFPVIVPDTGFQRFNSSFAHEDYFFAYLDRFGFSEKAVEDFTGICRKVDYLAAQSVEAKQVFARARIEQNAREQDYRALLDTVNRSIGALWLAAHQAGRETDFERGLTEYRRLFNEVAKNHTNEEGTDLRMVEVMFREPLKAFLHQHLHTRTEAPELIGQVVEAGKILGNIRFANEGTAGDFSRTAAKWREALSELTALSAEINTRVKYR